MLELKQSSPSGMVFAALLSGCIAFAAPAAPASGDRSLDFDRESPAGDLAESPRVTGIFSDGYESGDTSAWGDTTAPQCPAPTGGPTMHANSLPANETWTANGSPHVLTTNVTVPAGITLTISPCAEVRLRSGVNIIVLGTLVARGTPLQRIAIHRDDPALAFAYLWVRSPATADIAYADITGGGSSDAAVLIEGVDNPPVQPAILDHVKVVGSARYGVRLFRNAGFAGASRDLVVSGSGATQPGSPYPIRMDLAAVSTVPTGVYRGNASDLLQVLIGAVLQSDLTFHERGTPYQLGGGGSTGVLTVSGSPSLATLTVEAGVEMRFNSEGSNIGGLFLGANSRLVAVGTAALPILFTGIGGAPLPGSWEGITFTSAVDPGTLLDHVRIDAAGAHGGDQGFGCPPPPDTLNTDGALKIFVQPASEFLVNSTISNSFAHGVFRAWTGTEVDFLASNTFVGIARCQQVLPHPPPPASCPVNPPCPQ